MKKIILKIISIYQKTISPDHGANRFNAGIGCKYYPSCSQYSKESIIKYGLIKGSIKGIWRIMRCNPFSRGGIDCP